MADAFRSAALSRVSDPINQAQEAANKHLDTITDIKTRADTIAKTMGKMKIFTGSKAIGEKVSKVYAKEIADAKSVVTKPIKEFTGKIGDAISEKIVTPIKTAFQAARDAADATWRGNAWSQRALANGRMGASTENGLAGAGKTATTTAADDAAAAAATGSGVIPDADAAAAAAATRAAASGAGSAAGADADGLGAAAGKAAAQKVETIVAKKAAGAVGKAAGEEAGGEAAGGILDAIPGGEAIGVIVGAITTAIAAHKAHKAMRADANQPSAINVVNSSFQSGIGTDM